MDTSEATPVWRRTGLVVAGVALVGTLGALAPAVAGSPTAADGSAGPRLACLPVVW